MTAIVVYAMADTEQPVIAPIAIASQRIEEARDSESQASLRLSSIIVFQTLMLSALSTIETTTALLPWLNLVESLLTGLGGHYSGLLVSSLDIWIQAMEIAEHLFILACQLYARIDKHIYEIQLPPTLLTGNWIVKGPFANQSMIAGLPSMLAEHLMALVRDFQIGTSIDADFIVPQQHDSWVKSALRCS